MPPKFDARSRISRPTRGIKGRDNFTADARQKIQRRKRPSLSNLDLPKVTIQNKAATSNGASASGTPAHKVRLTSSHGIIITTKNDKRDNIPSAAVPGPSSSRDVAQSEFKITRTFRNRISKSPIRWSNTKPEKKPIVAAKVVNDPMLNLKIEKKVKVVDRRKTQPAKELGSPKFVNDPLWSSTPRIQSTVVRGESSRPRPPQKVKIVHLSSPSELEASPSKKRRTVAPKQNKVLITTQSKVIKIPDPDAYERETKRLIPKTADSPRRKQSVGTQRLAIEFEDQEEERIEQSSESPDLDESSSRTSSDDEEKGTKVHISNLHPIVDKDDIVELFGMLGTLHRVDMLPGGEAEVLYEKAETAYSAHRRYHNRELDGMPMKVTVLEKPPTPVLVPKPAPLPPPVPQERTIFARSRVTAATTQTAEAQSHVLRVSAATTQTAMLERPAPPQPTHNTIEAQTSPEPEQHVASEQKHARVTAPKVVKKPVETKPPPPPVKKTVPVKRETPVASPQQQRPVKSKHQSQLPPAPRKPVAKKVILQQQKPTTPHNITPLKQVIRRKTPPPEGSPLKLNFGATKTTVDSLDDASGGRPLKLAGSTVIIQEPDEIQATAVHQALFKTAKQPSKPVTFTVKL